jgi:hypothetical protein
VRRQAINVQNMTELRPNLNEMGAKKKPPVAKPAEAAEFYQLLIETFSEKSGFENILAMQYV